MDPNDITLSDRIINDDSVTIRSVGWRILQKILNASTIPFLFLFIEWWSRMQPLKTFLIQTGNYDTLLYQVMQTHILRWEVSNKNKNEIEHLGVRISSSKFFLQIMKALRLSSKMFHHTKHLSSFESWMWWNTAHWVLYKAIMCKLALSADQQLMVCHEYGWQIRY